MDKENNKIEVSDLHKAFGRKRVLNGVDLKIKKGESLVVIGGSGTGKSVLIKCIQGLIRPDSSQDFLQFSLVGAAFLRFHAARAGQACGVHFDERN